MVISGYYYGCCACHVESEGVWPTQAEAQEAASEHERSCTATPARSLADYGISTRTFTDYIEEEPSEILEVAVFG